MTAIPNPRVVDFCFDLDGARLLAGYPQFFELKRTRAHPRSSREGGSNGTDDPS